MNSTLMFLLISRIILYLYVFFKAWEYRNSILGVSSFWLGALAISAILAASSMFTAQPIVRAAVGYLVALSMFMLTLTARELTKVEGNH